MHYSAELSLSPNVHIYLVRRGGRKHILLDTAVPLPWRGKTAGVVSGRCSSSNVYVCPYMENAIAVVSQIEEMILKNNQIDGRTINLKGGTPTETTEIWTHICSYHNLFPLSCVQILLIPACCLLCVL